MLLHSVAFRWMRDVGQLFKTNHNSLNIIHVVPSSVGKVVKTTVSGSFDSPQQQQEIDSLTGAR